MASHIHCSSQQSRFHLETLNTSREIDLKDVTISVGPSSNPTDLLTSAHLRVKEGVRYGLVGRNGTGKSTLLKAVAERLIPGLNPTIRVLLLSQIEDAERGLNEGGGTVLEHVVRGDKGRQRAVDEFERAWALSLLLQLARANNRGQAELRRAVESPSPLETQKIVHAHLLAKAEDDLVEARKIASLRSGTRGKEAREEELRAEEKEARARSR